LPTRISKLTNLRRLIRTSTSMVRLPQLGYNVASRDITSVAPREPNRRTPVPETSISAHLKPECPGIESASPDSLRCSAMLVMTLQNSGSRLVLHRVAGVFHRKHGNCVLCHRTEETSRDSQTRPTATTRGRPRSVPFVRLVASPAFTLLGDPRCAPAWRLQLRLRHL
jgi:hypothetical protein